MDDPDVSSNQKLFLQCLYDCVCTFVANKLITTIYNYILLLLEFQDDRLIRSLLSGLDVYNFAMIPFSTAVMLELKYSHDLGFFVNIHLKNSTQDPFLLTMPGTTTCLRLNFIQLSNNKQ